MVVQPTAAGGEIAHVPVEHRRRHGRVLQEDIEMRQGHSSLTLPFSRGERCGAGADFDLDVTTFPKPSNQLRQAKGGRRRHNAPIPSNVLCPGETTPPLLQSCHHSRHSCRCSLGVGGKLSEPTFASAAKRNLCETSGLEMADISHTREQVEAALGESDPRARTLDALGVVATWFGSPSGLNVGLQPARTPCAAQSPEEALADGWTGAVHPGDVIEATAKW